MSPFTAKQHQYARLIVVPVAASVMAHLVFYKRYPYEAHYAFPWPYFLTVATVMLCCWEVNLAIFRTLDHRLPFSSEPVKRIRRQVLMGGSATLLTFAVVFPLAIRVYSGQWPTAPLLTSGALVCTTLATLVNGGYVGLYLLQTIRQKNDLPATAGVIPQRNVLPSEPTSHWLTIETGTRQLRLATEDIAYFYSSGGLVLLVKTDGQRLTTTYSSFGKIESQLSATQFFQVNRQFIVNPNAIRQVCHDVNQKLLIDVTPALRNEQAVERVTVSRYRSAAFKKWFRQTAPA